MLLRPTAPRIDFGSLEANEPRGVPVVTACGKVTHAVGVGSAPAENSAVRFAPGEGPIGVFGVNVVLC